MTPVTCMAGRKLALFGLGGSGLATALALKAGGADVVAWDDGEAARAKAQAAGIATADLREADWSDLAGLVLAPGVPLTHPAPHWTVGPARAAGIPVIGDIELFCRERAAIAPGSPFVAITGTNGKSTTTALVSHILRMAGRDVQMGGNIGTPILDLAPPSPDRVHVIEMSSFQIDLTPSLDPSVGVLLNVSPDHLDRHGTMESYAAIKHRLVLASEVAVLGSRDPWTQAVWEATDDGRRHRPRILPPEVVYGGGRLFTGARWIAEIGEVPTLRGAHNAQNLTAAVTVALHLGVPDPVIGEAVRSFPGLPHRMEEVRRSGGALFINDSKATNADSAEKALLAFTHIHWIAGGKAKAGGIEPLQPLFTRIDKAYLIGEAQDAFAATLEGRVPYERCGTLERAVAAAAEDVLASNAREPVVLLSPACASYDQFPNFEVRGDRFRSLVLSLPGSGLPGPALPRTSEEPS